MHQPDTVTLRLARAPEAPAMALMSRELIETGLGWRYTPLRMAMLMRDANTVALVATEASAAASIAGFAVMQFGDERAHLVLLCVQATQQRRGIGRRLLAWLTLSAQVAGIAKIQLELRADNQQALAFYRQQGYVEDGLIAGYYGGTVAARRMACSLRSAS